MKQAAGFQVHASSRDGEPVPDAQPDHLVPEGRPGSKQRKQGGATWQRPLLWTLWVLAAYMNLNILVSPASWRAGMEGYELVVPPDFPSPADAITKYAGHMFVKATHILPGAAWILLAPLQVQTAMQGGKQRMWWHRVQGRVFFGLSALMMVGYVQIEREGLSFSYDVRWVTTMASMAVWFVITGVAAWRLAVRRRFEAHIRWAVRHVAAGAWVVTMRMLLLGSYLTGLATPTEAADKDWAFGCAAIAGWLITVGGVELMLRWPSGQPDTSKVE